ncbi:DUF3303 domain-containing protein [Nocardia aurantiaca]|uniref:DUF3303 domain-containing protein n=1 Tax=Nocardia aurantiaca TaxID=2675850 RepID=A0A6I3L569_9NOCA|nr:DUF3303 family protein [Nocardia aurantiaca]MTE16671.1 DUF3303 domain-containing protein [Nocardia aurantiaca]
MKYVASWQYQWNSSASENEASIQRALQAYSKWTPVAGLTYHQFLGRLDNRGGFVVVETDDPLNLLDAPSKFGFFSDYDIYPVVDIVEAIRANQEGVEFRKGLG